MKAHQIFASAASFVLLGFGSPVGAAVTLPINMNFQSGATFSGDVTFADDYSQVLGVAGVLHGYTYGGDYDGVSDDAISWVWTPGVNYSGTPSTFSTFLMDGPPDSDFGPGGYTHWVSFSYDYSAAPGLTFTDVGLGNNVDYGDHLVAAVSAVPEPATWVMMILGFGAIGVGLRAARRPPPRPVTATERM